MTDVRPTNRAIAQCAVRAVVTGDVSGLQSFFSTEVRLRNQTHSTAEGLTGVRERALIFASALWDSAVSFQLAFESGDVVVLRWQARGIHKGRIFAQSPTNRPAQVDGVSVLRLRDGLVVEDWTEFCGIRSQALLPPPRMSPAFEALAVS